MIVYSENSIDFSIRDKIYNVVAVVDSWYIGHGQGLKVSHYIMIMPVARSRARSISASTESPIILSTVPDAGTFKKQPTNYSLIVDHVSPWWLSGSLPGHSTVTQGSVRE